MSKVRDAVIAVVAAFVLLPLLNAAASYLLGSSGSVLVGPGMVASGQAYSSVVVTNVSSRPIDGLLLSVPVSTTVRSIAASGGVQIDEVASSVGTSSEKQIRVSGIQPNKVTSLLIPVGGRVEADDVGVVNARQVGVDVEPRDDTRRSFLRELQGALPASIVQALLYALVMAIFTSQRMGTEERWEKRERDWENGRKDFEAELTRIREEHDRTGNDLKRVRGDIKRVERDHRKIGILLQARLSDYAMELAFWRDTARKIMYDAGKDDGAAEKLVRAVTENLKTYSTLGKSAWVNFETSDVETFESLKILAGLLKDEGES